MVLSALNKKSITDLGLKTACYISDKIVTDKARKLNKTRSEMAMRYAAEEINGGIVVIGNAPTALYECNDEKGLGRVPVGFVSASESKEELNKINTPSIFNVGRKGGSPVASSIVNAILLLYKRNL